MNIENIIKSSLAAGMKSLFGAEVKGEEIVLQSTKKEFEGTYTFTTFTYAKITRLSPEETGKKLGEYLLENSGVVAAFNVVKGFLNLVITEQAWAKLFVETLSKDNFAVYPSNGKKVMVEYSSPNTNKPLHLGHLRNNFLGFSISEILKAYGYEVIKANLINDRGIHICKSMLAYQKFGKNETPESSGLKGDHLVGKYYVEFDKALKLELKPILEAVYNRKSAGLFSEEEQKLINVQLENFDKLKKFHSDELQKLKSVDFSSFADLKEELAQTEIKWKELLKKSEGILTADKYKELAKIIKPTVLLEEKIDTIMGDVKEIAQKKTALMIEAQQMLNKWEQGDKEVMDLWKKMNNWVYDGFNATYKMIGVDFDKFYYESNTYLLGKEIVEEGLKSKAFFKKDNGSSWVDLTSEGLDEKLLLRSDGTSVYITQDLGTAELKYKEFGAEKSIYVVGNEQDRHFNVLKLILKKLNKSYAEGLYHMSYGMVDLPSGKMKSREGTVVDADDLVDSMIKEAKAETESHGKTDGFSEEEADKLFHVLGLGALKYYLLRVDPKKRMMFNPEESIQLNGDTGPYIQYAYARSRSIMRKADQGGMNYEEAVYKSYSALHPAEISLIIALNNYSSAIKEASEQYSPAVISQYCIELAREFNRFWNEVSIMAEPDIAAKAFRLALTNTTGKIIKKSMLLLGVEVPERM
jgi:arginyl-tRNA synthetase